MMIKHSKWEGELSTYLQIGDLVDEDFVEYFVNVLPPACMTGGVIQMGEPSDFVDGRSTYPTLKRTPAGYVYAGNCHRGQTENMEGLQIVCR